MRHEGDKPFEQRLMDALCEVYNLRPAAIRSKSQTRYVSEARLLGYYLLRKHGGHQFSWSAIGHFFGGRTHQPVLNGARRTERMLRVNPRLLGQLDRVMLLLEVPPTPCASFVAFFVAGRPGDYALPQDRSPADICAQAGCVAPRAAHKDMAMAEARRHAA